MLITRRGEAKVYQARSNRVEKIRAKFFILGGVQGPLIQLQYVHSPAHFNYRNERRPPSLLVIYHRLRRKQAKCWLTMTCVRSLTSMDQDGCLYMVIPCQRSVYANNGHINASVKVVNIHDGGTHRHPKRELSSVPCTSRGSGFVDLKARASRSGVGLTGSVCARFYRDQLQWVGLTNFGLQRKYISPGNSCRDYERSPQTSRSTPQTTHDSTLL